MKKLSLFSVAFAGVFNLCLCFADISLTGSVQLTGNHAVSFVTNSTWESVSGLKVWIDPSTNITYGDSNRVSQLVDRASGLVFSQATAGSRPEILTNELNGYSVIASDGTARFLATPTNQPSINNYTAFIVMKIISGSQNFFAKGDTGTRQEFYWFSSGAASIAFATYDNNGSFQATLQGVTFTDTGTANYSIVCISKDGMHVNWYRNTTNRTISAGSNPTFNSPVNSRYVLLGSSSAGSTQTRIAELLLYDRNLLSSEKILVHNYLTNKYAFNLPTFAPITTNRQGIVFLGDSQTAGVNVTPFPKEVMDDATIGLNKTGRVWDYAINGWSGRYASEILDRIGTEVTPYLSANDRVVFWAGSNDLKLGGQTTNQIIASQDGIAQAITNVSPNIERVFLTMMNRGSFTATEGSTNGVDTGHQLTVNTHIRGMTNNLVSAVYDVQAETNLQDTANLTYYQNDGGSHLTQLSYDTIIAPAIVTILNALP